jgi:hypothetical protein
VVGSQPWQIVHETLSWKYPTQKRTGRMAQVVESLLNKVWDPEFKPQKHTHTHTHTHTHKRQGLRVQLSGKACA